MSAILQGNSLYLTGVVGEAMFEDAFSSEDVLIALNGIDDGAPLTVHINSPGGDAFDGSAIHALLRARAGRTDVVVSGLAASAGSLIAMAGATVTMSAGALMMIHDCSTITWGNSAQHQRNTAMLEALSDTYAKVYALKSGKSARACRDLMKAETWFSPEEAVAARFADRTTEIKASAVPAFAYAAFAHAPPHLVELARAKNWTLPGASIQPQKESTMPGQNPAGDAVAQARAAVQARIKAIMTHTEAAGREALAEHLAFETDLDENAIAAVLAKAPKAGSGGPQSAAWYDDMRAGDPIDYSNADAVRRAAAEGRLPPPGEGGRPYNGQGLAVGSGLGGRPGAAPRADLAANMKRRHGIT